MNIVLLLKNNFRYVLLFIILIMSMYVNNYIIFFIAVIESIISVIMSKFGHEKLHKFYYFVFLLVFIIIASNINNNYLSGNLFRFIVILFLGIFFYSLETAINQLLKITPKQFNILKNKINKVNKKTKRTYVIIIIIVLILIIGNMMFLNRFIVDLYRFFSEILGQAIESIM